VIVSRGLVGWVGERERPVARRMAAVTILCLASLALAAAPVTVGILVLFRVVA
jgi:hypothetical protein